MSEDSLYSRQSKLRLNHYKNAVVIGLGGVGNWVAMDLALSGVIRNLFLIDPDIIEKSNLNRTFFTITDIGLYKCDAVARHIYYRRSEDIDIVTCNKFMTDELCQELIINKLFKGDNSQYHSDTVIIDCRDDIFNDLYKVNCKLYKVGYDGCNITIDGNPRLTKVIGQRGGSYSVVPSYICSSQLAAILVVNDILYPKFNHMNNDNLHYVSFNCGENFPYLDVPAGGCYDELGRINTFVNIDTTEIMDKFIANKNDYIEPNYDFENLPYFMNMKKEEEKDE